MHRLAPIALALLLAACHRAPEQQDLNGLDAELANGADARDPAVAQALGSQIMVDPRLAQSSNADVIRPPARPDTGATPPDDIAAKGDGIDPTTLDHAPKPEGDCPDCKAKQGALTLAALAGRQRDPHASACAGGVSYSAGYANRLPADLPLFPNARVIEAAGNDAKGCALRVVSFATGAPPARVIDWYYTQTHRAGYALERQADSSQQVLGGQHGGVAFVLYVAPGEGGGSTVDLIASGDR